MIKFYINEGSKGKWVDMSTVLYKENKWAVEHRAAVEHYTRRTAYYTDKVVDIGQSSVENSLECTVQGCQHKSFVSGIGMGMSAEIAQDMVAVWGNFVVCRFVNSRAADSQEDIQTD